jgi:hypothetical protein
MEITLRGGPFGGEVLEAPGFVDWLPFCTDPTGKTLYQYHHYGYRGPACTVEPGDGFYLDYNGVSDSRRQRRDDRWEEGHEYRSTRTPKE